MMSAGLHALRLASLAILFLGVLIATSDAQAAAGAGHAPASSTSGGMGGGPNLQTEAIIAKEGGDAVKAVTRVAESTISACPENNPRCVADALDAYADALRNLSPPLPPDLQSLPDIVSRAARRIRQAKTKAQAVRAIKFAIAEVHKTISLIKADDPVVLTGETREGAFVAETLEVADNTLEKAVGL